MEIWIQSVIIGFFIFFASVMKGDEVFKLLDFTCGRNKSEGNSIGFLPSLNYKLSQDPGEEQSRKKDLRRFFVKLVSQSALKGTLRTQFLPYAAFLHWCGSLRAPVGTFFNSCLYDVLKYLSCNNAC